MTSISPDVPEPPVIPARRARLDGDLHRAESLNFGIGKTNADINAATIVVERP
jgi:hypothetical protein